MRSSRHCVLLLCLLGAGALAGCGGTRSINRTSAAGLPSGPYFIMPVRGIQPSELSPNFGAPRGGGTRRHEGLDIMAPKGREVLACVAGKILAKKWNELGGNTIWLAGDDGRVYYFAHLSSYNETVQVGDRVRAAEVIGYVGNTGDAQGGSPHLHFEIHDRMGGPSYDPYPVLTSEGILVMALTPQEAKSLKRTGSAKRR